MAEHYAQEWKRARGSEDTIGFNKKISSIRALREMHVEEARVWASSLGLRADDIRKACLSFPSKTAIDLDQHVFTDIALLPTMPWILWVRSSDNVLSSWPHQLSHFCNFWSCWARKMEGAEPSPSCTQHIASPCVWSQHTSVNGMSSLQVSGTQYVIHFRWDMRKFYDSITAHLLFPQLVARG